MARTTRLLTLLQLLRSKTRAVRAGDLATELGISERTVYRDIAELSAMGAPITGEAGVGYLLRPGLFLPPLMFTDDEVEAIVLGLRYVDQRGDRPLRASATHALAKIRAVLPPENQAAVTDPSVLPGPPPDKFPENVVDLGTLRAAIRRQLKLRIGYRDVADVRTDRVIWPVALGFMDHARVLVAWCETRRAYRTFRTDRLTEVEDLAEQYPGRRGMHVEKWRAQARSKADGFSPDKI